MNSGVAVAKTPNTIAGEQDQDAGRDGDRRVEDQQHRRADHEQHQRADHEFDPLSSSPRSVSLNSQVSDGTRMNRPMATTHQQYRQRGVAPGRLVDGQVGRQDVGRLRGDPGRDDRADRDRHDPARGLEALRPLEPERGQTRQRGDEHEHESEAGGEPVPQLRHLTVHDGQAGERQGPGDHPRDERACPELVDEVLLARAVGVRAEEDRGDVRPRRDAERADEQRQPVQPARDLVAGLYCPRARAPRRPHPPPLRGRTAPAATTARTPRRASAAPAWSPPRRAGRKRRRAG